MKSIIFLLLTTCCLFPFSSATFTSNNPIILPTTTHDNNIEFPAIRDADGHPVKTGEKYTIYPPQLGPGPVYWGRIGHPICPNAVLQHTPRNLGPPTPVKFVLISKPSHDGDVVREWDDVNIMFSVHTSEPCANETVWQIDDTAFLVTGGTLGNKRGIFKIWKYEGTIKPLSKYAYKLMYCSLLFFCDDVNVIWANGHLRLTASGGGGGGYPFIFYKEKNA